MRARVPRWPGRLRAKFRLLRPATTIQWPTRDRLGTRSQASVLVSPKGHAFMATSLSARSIVVASSNQVSCPLGDESAILNLSNTVYYGLDPVGTRVWHLLQKPKSVSELRDALVDEYDVDAERCENDLLELLEKMRVEGLIVVESATGV